MDRIESDGRAMEARDGYGETTTFRKLSDMSFRDKANQWKFTCETSVTDRSFTVAARYGVDGEPMEVYLRDEL